MSQATARGIAPSDVLDRLKRNMLIDGFPFVVDMDKSHGSWLVDAVHGKKYLDLFTFFASAPLGVNHPRLKEEELVARFGRIAANKPSNSDFYTVEMAEFVDTLYGTAMPAELGKLFMVSGGAPAVENGLKTAFDWKVRKNLAQGQDASRGSQVLHFEEAFHGRLGYTLSLTNTDPVKTDHFPKFDWPRVLNPKMRFPQDAAAEAEVKAAEERSLAQIERAFGDTGDDIAAIIIEPIQGEGGDNHFRGEFLRELRRIADQHEALLVFDEVQTGVGMTGKMWAFQHFGVVPDVLVFGKKMQVCGICVTDRVDEVEDHVFETSSRINSTWGGNLIDMLRATEYLRIIDNDGLVDNAKTQGQHLLAGVTQLANEFAAVSNPRGRGLMVAFDLTTPEMRGKVAAAALERELIVVGTGTRGIRFRPALNITAAELDEGLGRLREALRAAGA